MLPAIELLHRSAPGAATAAATEAATAEPRIRQITEGIADHVEAEDNEAKSKTREEYRPPVALQHKLTALLITQICSPGRRAERNANAKEADRRLGEDRYRKQNTAEDYN